MSRFMTYVRAAIKHKLVMRVCFLVAFASDLLKICFSIRSISSNVTYMSLTAWLEEDFDINTIASFRQRDTDFRAKDSLGTSPEPFIAMWEKM